MSDQNSVTTTNNPVASSSTFDSFFASKFPFAALTFASAEKRRKVAGKFVRTGIPADAAAAAAIMHRDSNETGLPATSERTNPVGTALTVLPRLRVIVPLIEPNVLAMARGYSRTGPTPTVTQDPDGTWIATWQTHSDHVAATAAIVADYHATHEVTRSIAEGRSRLDSWHNPFLLVPVRHQYTDGTPGVTRWMCADGNAMLVGARYALAADLNRWAIDHPYADPTALWPADMATLRTVVAAARQVLTEDLDPATAAWPLASPVEQWADFLTPTPDVGPLIMSTWLYHEHNTASPVLANEVRVSDIVDEWLRGLDYFKGLTSETLSDIVGADPATREGRELIAEAEEEVDRFLRVVDTRKDIIAIQIAFAAAALSQTDVEDDVEASELFTGYTTRATSRVLDNPVLVNGLNTIRHNLASTRQFPDVDLYGIWQDLRSGIYDQAPFNDPTSNWFTLTAMVGLTYAALHGHFEFVALPTPLNDDYEHRTTTGEDTAVTVEEQVALEAEIAATAHLTQEIRMLDAFTSDRIGPATKATVYYAQCTARGEIPQDRYTDIAKKITTQMLVFLEDLFDKADTADSVAAASQANQDEPQ